ncbi:t16 [Tupaiid betaherpesvirus 1]|uniref:T16 n=1 Tax=Tupaiid herpesvirus 1 (strain 1) TaxID=10397 RepID=Q91TU6_TUHV1|nr:t16 [Tupaiid betaherpesvirus 1]AAK57041.1 t16 [Tupaiid betaherpesvirus 1]
MWWPVYLVCFSSLTNADWDEPWLREWPIDDSSSWPLAVLLKLSNTIDESDAAFKDARELWTPPTLYGWRMEGSLVSPGVDIRRWCREPIPRQQWQRWRREFAYELETTECDEYRVNVNARRSWDDSEPAAAATWVTRDVTVEVTETTVTCSVAIESAARPCRLVLSRARGAAFERVASVPLGDAAVHHVIINQTGCDSRRAAGTAILVAFGPEALDCGHDRKTGSPYLTAVQWETVDGTDGVWRCDLWVCGIPERRWTGHGSRLSSPSRVLWKDASGLVPVARSVRSVRSASVSIMGSRGPVGLPGVVGSSWPLSETGAAGPPGIPGVPAGTRETLRTPGPSESSESPRPSRYPGSSNFSTAANHSTSSARSTVAGVPVAPDSAASYASRETPSTNVATVLVFLVLLGVRHP